MTNPDAQNLPHPLITAAAIAALPEQVSVHPLNANAVRHTRSLAGTTGCLHLGVYLVRVQPGHYSTEYHRHRGEAEFLYALAGRGIASIDDLARHAGDLEIGSDYVLGVWEGVGGAEEVRLYDLEKPNR